MNCPVCQSAEVHVRTTHGNRRRRQCDRCMHRWTTIEVMETELEADRALARAVRDAVAKADPKAA